MAIDDIAVDGPFVVVYNVFWAGVEWRRVGIRDVEGDSGGETCRGTPTASMTRHRLVLTHKILESRFGKPYRWEHD